MTESGNDAGPAWDELVSTALLGTLRRPIDPSVLTASLPAALRPVVTGPPELALLTAAAALANYRRAGHVPARAGAAPQAAARDPRDVVPPAARQRLARLLATAGPELLEEWLRAVRTAGLRVPPERLPALADAARGAPALRAPLVAVAGAAGSWLGARNPAWDFLVAPVGSDQDIWRYGSPLQRRALLAEALAADPGGARKALAATWPDEPAAMRADLLGALGTHLRLEDEEFLEVALDDRASSVRERAAELLAALPESRLAARMAERAARAVALRRGTPAGDVLVVTPPAAGDASSARDGVPDDDWRGEGGIGRVRGIVAATPLAHWASYGTPEQLLRLPVEGCTPDVLREAWAEAAIRQRDAQWAIALLAAYRPGRAIAPVVAALVDVLPERERAAVAAALARAVAPEAFVSLVVALPRPWPRRLGDVLLDWLGAHPGHAGLATAAGVVATAVPLGCLRHPVATAPVPVGAAPWWRRLAATLTVRREMHEELR